MKKNLINFVWPPLLQNKVMSKLCTEDPLSFFDKEDGYYYHKQVLSRAKEFLKPDGVLYLEFDITQRERIEQLAKDYDYQNYSFLKGPYGHDYVIKLADKHDYLIFSSISIHGSINI